MSGNGSDPLAGASLGLPAGLVLRRRGDSLEVAHSVAGSVRLLAAASDLEVMEGSLQRDKRLHLVPSRDAGWHGSEVYLILSGSLRQTSPVGSLVLEPGDLLSVRELAEPVIFTTQTDVRFLYVTSQPSFHEISDSLRELRELMTTVEAKDNRETADHCRRMRQLAYALGRELDLGPDRMHLLDYASYFHDLGKIEVPGAILAKPAALTADEWRLVEAHPEAGRRMLAETFIRDAGTIVAQHHERLDGSGYPRGLQGEEICLEAYIIAVTDAFDAMTSDRPYRAALPRDRALAEITSYADRHYPRTVVDAFFKVLERSAEA